MEANFHSGLRPDRPKSIRLWQFPGGLTGGSMFLEFPLEPFKNWAQVASSIGSILALAAAGFWFFRTSKAKQRIQFDLDCRVYPLANNPDQKVA